MPWRLIVIIVIFAVFLCFIGFNLTNTCDISLGFKTFQNVPVYLTIFGSFILGMVGSLPFIIFGSLKKSPKKEKQPEIQMSADSNEAPVPPKSSKFKNLFRRKTDPSSTEKTDDNNPYGID